MVTVLTADQLLPKLVELERLVQVQLAEEGRLRNANSSFTPKNETTQLLLAACEKLSAQKEAMDRASFEEHTSELSYLCKHFGTSIDNGLGERALKEYAAANPIASNEKPKRKVPFACCQRDFPPQQSWWLDVNTRLTPMFRVLRCGKLATVHAAELQPGDIVYLSAGQRCVADGRILVHEQGTAVDVSGLTLDSVDVRVCTVDATAAPITDSANIVLRDSYLISGSLFCIVVRTPGNMLLPQAVEANADSPFAVETSVPPGMTVSQCRSLFKQLCSKSRLACRSFRAMAKLARAKSMVVLLTQEDLEKGNVPALAAVAKRLKRPLVIVSCGLQRPALETLAKELHVDLVDLKSTSTASTDLPGQEGSGGANTPMSTSPWGGRLHSTGMERARLQELAKDLINGVDGVVLYGVSQAGIVDFCGFLNENGSPPLYAMGAFQYPECFRTLVIRHHPRSSMVASSSCPSIETPQGLEDAPRNSRASAPRRHPTGAAPSPPPSAELSRAPTVSRMASMVSVSSQRSTIRTSSSAHYTVDPAAYLPQLHHQEAHFVELVVSLNAVGVVSEYADCVLLTSDLGSLGQALELAAKGVPAPALAAIPQVVTTPPPAPAPPPPEVAPEAAPPDTSA